MNKGNPTGDHIVTHLEDGLNALHISETPVQQSSNVMSNIESAAELSEGQQWGIQGALTFTYLEAK
jgi:hypothetical protein